MHRDLGSGQQQAPAAAADRVQAEEDQGEDNAGEEEEGKLVNNLSCVHIYVSSLSFHTRKAGGLFSLK